MVNACRDPESQKSPARALQATKLARWSGAEKNVDPLTIKRRHLEAKARRPRATGPAAAVLAADGCFTILRVPTVQVDIAPRQLAGANVIECRTKAKLSTTVTRGGTIDRATSWSSRHKTGIFGTAAKLCVFPALSAMRYHVMPLWLRTASTSR